MKKLRIGYQPLSPTLMHPGDRRRVVFWARQRGHKIITDLTEPTDVVLLSERANFGVFPARSKGVPIIFDLIDGYLEGGHLVHDWVRGLSKILTRQISGYPQPFSNFVKSICSTSSAIICSSPEQAATISPFSNNIHDILDFHDELPLNKFGDTQNEKTPINQILWEGMPATLSGLQVVQPALTTVQEKSNLRLNIVTDPEYFRVLGKFIHEDTQVLLEKLLKNIYSAAIVMPWSIGNLIAAANQSNAAIIPLELARPLQYLKPENRLLIMWRLGLPCLTSPTPAYIRVSSFAGSDTICYSENDWRTKLESILGDTEIAENIVNRGQAYLSEFHHQELLLEKWDRVFASVL